MSRNRIACIDSNADLHKYANMRTSIDMPDALFRHLKARAALEGTSLRELLIRLIERGLSAPEADSTGAERTAPPLPSIRAGAPLALRADRLSNAGLCELLDE